MARLESGQVEQLVRTGADDPPASPSPAQPRAPKPAALLEVEHQLAERLDTRVQVQLGDKRGKMVIEFADLEDLQRIYDILGR